MIPGFTSTASKAPEALFGDATWTPQRMTRARGCYVWDTRGHRYLDVTMALGAVSLGYAHPAVTEAVERAIRAGGVGPLAPDLEGRVAERLAAVVPGLQSVQFFKTGAEAVAAAVRLARVYTGCDAVVACGYHGWLDSVCAATGIPEATRRLRHEVPFNDVTAVTRAVADVEQLAALVLEPVVDGPPDPEWVSVVGRIARERGAVLIVDEIKTGLRLGSGGAATRYGLAGDLTVLGKALGNGLPVAAVGGRREIMDGRRKTWISSTLATEFVSLAAADAVLEVYEREGVATHLARVGRRLHDGLADIARALPDLFTGVRGIPELCYLAARDDDVSTRLARACTRRELLFKRNAYNFVSVAHDEAIVDEILERVEAAAREVRDEC